MIWFRVRVSPPTPRIAFALFSRVAYTRTPCASGSDAPRFAIPSLPGLTQTRRSFSAAVRRAIRPCGSIAYAAASAACSVCALFQPDIRGLIPASTRIASVSVRCEVRFARIAHWSSDTAPAHSCLNASGSRSRRVTARPTCRDAATGEIRRANPICSAMPRPNFDAGTPDADCSARCCSANATSSASCAAASTARACSNAAIRSTRAAASLGGAEVARTSVNARTDRTIPSPSGRSSRRTSSSNPGPNVNRTGAHDGASAANVAALPESVSRLPPSSIIRSILYLSPALFKRLLLLTVNGETGSRTVGSAQVFVDCDEFIRAVKLHGRPRDRASCRGRGSTHRSALDSSFVVCSTAYRQLSVTRHQLGVSRPLTPAR